MHSEFHDSLDYRVKTSLRRKRRRKKEKRRRKKRKRRKKEKRKKRSASQAKPFLLNYCLLWCFITAIDTLTRTEAGPRTAWHCCDRPDHVLGRVVEGLWNLGLEKPVSVEELGWSES